MQRGRSGAVLTTDGILSSKSAAKKTYIKRKKIYVLAAIGCLVIAIIAIVMFLHTRATDKNQDSVEVVKQEVARHYLLPTNEQPALATIVDKNKVNQTLFKNAQNGDKVLIYQKNHRYIIYRPSLDRIVDVGPVSIDTPPSQ